MCWVRCPLSAGRLIDHAEEYGSPVACLQYLLVEAISHFRFFNNDDLYRGFTYVHRTSFLALTQLVATRRVLLSRVKPRRNFHLRYVVRPATLFMAIESSSDIDGLLLY